MESLVQTHQVIEHLYIHVPFCLNKCQYCSFYSESTQNSENNEETKYYLLALEREIRYYQQLFDFQLKTVYFGGGTPSLLTPEQMSTILNVILKKSGVHTTKLLFDNTPKSDEIEITLECNPNTINDEKLARLKHSGINRISIGVQSFNNQILQYLGRIHDSDIAENAIKSVKRAGFKNFSVDLIYGIPDQSKAMFLSDINKCVEYQVPHISFYGLSLDEEVPLYRDLKKLPNEDEVCEQYYSAQKILENQQYLPYEISNFALEGFHSRHNMAYWQGKTYLAAGPSASGYLKACNRDMKYIRYTNSADLKKYKDKWLINVHQDFEQVEMINQEEAEKEFIITRLRLKDGIQLKEYQEIFLKDFLIVYQKQVKKLVKVDLIHVTDQSLCIKREHYLLMNEIILEFI
ncbi:MAG: radical SAM family heme chaperone HemW [Candidatus Cloacimonetes bacterium]|nr:radical SAM family heme chaperone HemW [Candidatus Cloacimonadota bacterium]